MLAGWYGWNWWKDRGEQDHKEAAALYQQAIQDFDELKYAEGEALIETLRKEHADSPYVDAADMIAARVFVESNELDKAVQRLERVAANAKDAKLRPVAKIRLARVQAAQGKLDAALATLGTASMGAQEGARLEARGDVLLAKGDRAGALAEYEAARKVQPPSTDASPETTSVGLLDLKIADLKGAPLPGAMPALAAPAADKGPAPATFAPVKKP
jgi:predicted negative regulator of RcsB-dependent stress response